LFDALEKNRARQNVPLFNYMLQGLNLNTNISGYGAIGACVAHATGSTAPGVGKDGCGPDQVCQRGSAHLRCRMAANIASGDYVTVVNGIIALAPGSTNISGFQNVATLPTGVTAVQRALRNGCDRIANGSTTANVNANGSKTFRIWETLSAQLRIDVRNVMNHPYVSDLNPFDIQ